MKEDIGVRLQRRDSSRKAAKDCSSSSISRSRGSVKSTLEQSTSSLSPARPSIMHVSPPSQSVNKTYDKGVRETLFDLLAFKGYMTEVEQSETSSWRNKQYQSLMFADGRKRKTAL